MVRQMRRLLAFATVGWAGFGMGLAEPPADPAPRFPSYPSPKDATAAFLAAAKAKDPVRLREATAIHSVKEETTPKTRALFTAILAQKLSKEDLEDLASKLDGFKVAGTGTPIQTGQLYVHIEKPGPNDTILRRLIKTQLEKTGRPGKSGWKVSRISRQRTFDKNEPWLEKKDPPCRSLAP